MVPRPYARQHHIYSGTGFDEALMVIVGGIDQLHPQTVEAITYGILPWIVLRSQSDQCVHIPAPGAQLCLNCSQAHQQSAKSQTTSLSQHS